MCLTTKWKKAKIAKKDITVWKIFFENINNHEGLSSVCYNKEMEPGVLYDNIYNNGNPNTLQVIAFPGATGFNEVEHGYHAYQNKMNARDSHFGFHVVRKCIIPKGSEYVKSKNDQEIVSNQLIILEK